MQLRAFVNAIDLNVNVRRRCSVLGYEFRLQAGRRRPDPTAQIDSCERCHDLAVPV